MKNAYWMTLASSFIWLTGCASTPPIAVVTAIGPQPEPRISGQSKGFLEVYSAREIAVVDPNTEEFFWNNDFGKNEFLHGPAHSGYIICTADRKAIKQVRNARGMNDAHPSLVELFPGMYKVQALAEDYNAATFETVVPVVIQAGQTTEVHLDGAWKPAGRYQSSDVVRLPNGRIAGWRATEVANLSPSTPPQPD